MSRTEFSSPGATGTRVAFQTHTGSQASSRGEAKDSSLPSSPDRYLLEPTEKPKESSLLWSLERGLGFALHARQETSPSSRDDGGISWAITDFEFLCL